jgi:hypothetical protein
MRVTKVYNSKWHTVLNSLDNGVNEDGQNIHLLFHCAPSFQLYEVAHHGFGIYQDPSHLLLSNSVSMAKNFASKHVFPGAFPKEMRESGEALVVMAKAGSMCRAMNASPEELENYHCFVLPVFEGSREFIYVFLSPQRLVPCYVVQYTSQP